MSIGNTVSATISHNYCLCEKNNPADLKKFDKVGTVQNALQSLPIFSVIGLRLWNPVLLPLKAERAQNTDIFSNDGL